MTARWVVDEVKDKRDLNITWQPISLLLKNQPPEDSDYHAPLLKTYKMLRVLESVRAAEGNDGMFKLYWQLGARIHHDQDYEFEITEALEAAGLPLSHAEAFESEEFDAGIRERHDAGLALTGEDVGTPIIAMTDPRGVKQGIFGPVITKVPEGDDALTLWDGMTMMMSIDGFWELKRTRTRGPEFPARPE
ncbi:MAG: disulfide bond formation protein DsbA [Actinomycetota bacterium]